MLEQENNTSIIMNYAKKNLDENSLKKVGEMHQNLYKKINSELGNIHSQELTKQQVSLIQEVCRTTSKALNYEIGEVPSSGISIRIKVYFINLYYKISQRIFIYIFYHSPFWIRKIILKRAA